MSGEIVAIGVEWTDLIYSRVAAAMEDDSKVYSKLFYAGKPISSATLSHVSNNLPYLFLQHFDSQLQLRQCVCVCYLTYTTEYHGNLTSM